MKACTLEITENKPIVPLCFKMSLRGAHGEIKAGQFINIMIDGFYLRRPISVYDWDDDTLTVIYKVVGQGTDALSKMDKGKKLDVLSELGNGYKTSVSGMRPLLIGGGVGVPPLYALAKALIKDGCNVSVILGFNTKSEIILADEFRALGASVSVTTVDGSEGVRGFVTDAIPYAGYTYVYTCGPEPMLKSVYNKIITSGQFSFEERMGCGFGACVGCTCRTKYGNKRVCKDGPVFVKEEIIW